MKIGKLIRLMHVLLSENTLSGVSRFCFQVLLNRESIHSLSIHGNQVFIRSNRTDVKVAFDSLGQEFDEAIKRIPENASGVIIDAGGYIGTSAIKFAKAFPTCDVYVLEPSTKNLVILRENVREFTNIHVVEAAICNSDEDRVLKDRGTGAWGYTTLETSADVGATTEIERIRSVTFAQIWDLTRSREMVLLKLDIEGGEFPLLQEAEDWMSRFPFIVIELHERIVPGVREEKSSPNKLRNR